MKRLRSALVVLPLLAVAACNTGSPHHATVNPGRPASPRASRGADGACAPNVVANICVTVKITGAVSVSGTGSTVAPEPVNASAASTCTELATMNNGGERDLGGGLDSVAGHKVVWDEDLSRFTGPGTYDLSSSDFYVTVDGTSFLPHDSTASVTVKPGFATTYSFTDLRSESGTISGTISWTCVEPS